MTTESKEIKFVFRDSDGKDLIGSSFIVDSGINWIELEKRLAEFLKGYTGKDERISAALLCNNWMTLKGFPDGMHFFINWNNEWGFVSAYLFRKKEGE
jgi:hypothetical protein